MSWRNDVYLVIDRGGTRDNAWEEPYLAFSSKGAAMACALKRTGRGAKHPECRWPGYTGSGIKAVRLVMDGKPGMWDGLGRSALRRLVNIGEHVAKGEPLEFFGARYVPEGGRHG